MVELLVTLAIMVVLAGVASMSLLAYNDYATFKRQNEYAQSLFVAAQNALTRYSEKRRAGGNRAADRKNGLPLEKEMLRTAPPINSTMRTGFIPSSSIKTALP